jgi:hypothetical protein
LEEYSDIKSKKKKLITTDSSSSNIADMGWAAKRNRSLPKIPEDRLFEFLNTGIDNKSARISAATAMEMFLKEKALPFTVRLGLTLKRIP